MANAPVIPDRGLDPELAAILGEVSARIGTTTPSGVFLTTTTRPRVCTECAKIPEHLRPSGWKESPGMIVRKDGIPIQTALCERHTELERQKRRQLREQQEPIAMPNARARMARSR